MNNTQGSFAHSAIKQNSNINTRIPVREFIFEDITDKGSFLFREMTLELFSNGKWSFYLTAEGNRTTTILRSGRKCGPSLFITFKDKQGKLLSEAALGQVNYDCKEDSVNNYVCKGSIDKPELIESVEVRYEAFMDFSCGRN